MDLPSFVDVLSGLLFEEPATSEGESIEIAEWKTVQEKIKIELEKEPQLMEKLKSFLSSSITDVKFAFMRCLLTNSTVKKILGEYAANCKQQIKMGTAGKKNAATAASIRLQGNQNFVKKEYRAAFKLYTRGLMFVRDEDDETPLLYANRSAAYYYLKQYDNALEDIERALKLGYGNYGKPIGKLLIRKGFSLLALGRDEQAKELLDANMPANEDDPDFAQWQQLKKESANMNHKITKRNITLSQFQDVSTIRTAVTTEEIYRPHERFPWLNAKIDLLYDAEKGYHLVSKEEMKYGEIVALSKPFVSLDPKRDSFERCHYCMMPCFEVPKYFDDDKAKLSPDSLRMATPLPCTECCNVLYCSEACRTAAWTAYHRLECAQMGILAKMDSKVHLGLRMFYMTGSLEKNSLNAQMIDGWETIADHCALMIDQQAFSFVYSNHMTSLVGLDEMFERTLTVGFLLKLVQMSGLLVKSKNIGDKEYIEQAGDAYFLIFRHLMQVDFNETMPFTNPITDRRITPSAVLSVDGMTALMKHSCEATVATSSILRDSLESNVKLLYATGDIPAGTELSLAYETEESRNFEMFFRKAQLIMRYRFLCTCSCCVREERDCLDSSTGVYYPIACSLCGELMVRDGGGEEGDSSSVLDGSYRCSSTEGCNFKYNAQQMKNVYEQLGKIMEMMRALDDYTGDTHRTLEPKVKQLKAAIESTAQVLYGRSLFLAHLYARLVTLHLVITMVPISSRYSGPIGTALSSLTHTVDRGHLSTALLYTNKALDILESLKQGPGVKTHLADELAYLFENFTMIEPFTFERRFIDMRTPYVQAKGRYEALLKMTAYDSMVVSSLAAKG